MELSNGANPKSGVRLQIAILADPSDRKGKLPEVAGIEWLSSRKTASTLEISSNDRQVSSVNLEDPRFDLPFLIGIIAAGGDDLYEVLKAVWETRLPTSGVALRRIATWNAATIVAVALEIAAEALAAQRVRSGRAALDLATYRREFDRLQRDFSLLERYVGSQTFRAPTEIFEYSPEVDSTKSESGRSFVLNGQGTFGRKLAQGLPVDSLGLCGVSIYISSRPESARDPLRVSLRAIETDSVMAEWSIDPAEAQIGWVDLALSYAIDEFALGLELIVEGPAESDEWSLEPGPPHPFDEFCARAADGRSMGSPIAMRLYSALPGVRVSPTTTSIKPVRAVTVLSEFIPFEAYKGIAQVEPPPSENKLTLVFYDHEIGCLTVHPRSGGPTVARLMVTVPRNVWGVSAQIHLAHERACPTAFAMMVCPQEDEGRELARIRKREAPSPTFSGWKTLSPLESKSISVVLPASPEEELSIYLLTRQAPDQSPDFGWARFSKLQFNLLPKTVIEQYRPESIRELAEEAGSEEEFVFRSTRE